MMSLIKGIPLTFYLTSIDKSISALLAQQVEEAEHRVLFEQVPPRCLAELPFYQASLPRTYICHQKLCHYLLVHPFNLVIKSNPLKYVLSRPAMSRRIAWWPLQLNKFDITIVAPKGLRSQALSDILAQLTSGGSEPLYKDLPGHEHLPSQGALPLMSLPPTEEVTHVLCCMLLMTLTSSSPSN